MGKILVVVEFLFSFSDVYISWNICFIKRLLESCYWTPGGSRKIPINSCQYFRPSVYPFVCPSTLLSVLSVWTFSWNFIIRFFKFWHGGGNRYEVVPYRVGISGRNFFWIYWKIWSLIFTEFVLQRKLMLFATLHKFHIWKKISWDMGQNVLSQSDCKVF